jgi:NADH-quinone oxidoreductase subunit L
MTHAFFKALLFLGAGSVIIGMHHNQDMRYMGGAWKYMKITWFTSLLGSLALIGTPFFAGFYSKDSIIEAAHAAKIPGAGFAYWCVLIGVFVTAFYSFRMYFLVFHGRERYEEMPHDDHGHDEHHGLGHGEKPHESPWVVTLPLVLLAIPSVVIGYIAIGPMLHGTYFDGVITVAANHPAMKELGEEFLAHHGALGMATHAFATAPFWLAVSGVVVAWYFYMVNPAIPAAIKARFSAIHTLLDNKYYMDRINEIVFAAGARTLGQGLWKVGDVTLIDGVAVNGSARLVGFVARVTRFFQTGHVYTYAFVMIVAVWYAITKFAFLGAGLLK